MADINDSISRLYGSMRDGDKLAEEQLFRAIYSEVRRRARVLVANEKPSARVSACGLVNEAYTHLAPNWPEIEDRKHLMNLLTLVMRRVLVDWARDRKRRTVSLDAGDGERTIDAILYKNGHALDPDDTLAVIEGLAILSRGHPQLAKILELYYYADLNQAEITKLLDLSLSECSRRFERAQRKLKIILGSKLGG